MTYAVIWMGSTVPELARVASASPDPAAVDREAVWMDAILRRYPHAMGESRWGPYRLWYADRIGIWYEVDDAAMTVRVLAVGPARRR